MEYQEIDTNQLNSVGGLDFQKIAKETYINVNKKLEHPPTILSKGVYNVGGRHYPIAFATAGNFSCIVGATKSKKTYLKSLITACYIGGGADKYGNGFISHREEDKYVLDFDTEQSEWHAQLVFKRVPQMVGENYKNYKPFYLRKLPPKERLQFIEWCIMESDYRDNIGLCSIDGAADLVVDVNNLEESNKLTQKFMQWTESANCHITTVIHKNFGSSKATGHLGSSITKKAETICMMDRQLVNEVPNGLIDVSFPYTRGFKIDDFVLNIDSDGLPIIENALPF